MFRFRRRGINERSDWITPASSSVTEINKCSDAINQESDESAAGEIVHNGTDDRVGGDSFQNRRAAGDDCYTDDQDGAGHGNDLLDALLAGADAGDMLADSRTAVGAYAAALDHEVGPAFGAFDFGSDRHRGTTKTLRATEFAGKRHDLRSLFHLGRG